MPETMLQMRSLAKPEGELELSLVEKPVPQPRDGDARAMYALLDTRAWLLRFERVAYDHEAAAAAIRATGALPEFFAQRLEHGQ